MSCAIELLPAFAIVFALHAVVFHRVAPRAGLRPALGLVWALLPAIVALPIYIDVYAPAACAPSGNLVTLLVVVSFVAAACLYLAVSIRTNLIADAPRDPAPSEFHAGREFRQAFTGRNSGQAPAVAALLFSVPVLGAVIGAVWLRIGRTGMTRL